MKKKNRLSAARNIPGLIFCCLWCCITVVIIGFVGAASLAGKRDVLAGTVFAYETGFHWENYVKAWSQQKLYLYFLNSLMYAAFAVVAGVGMSAPGAYVLSRYKFFGNQFIKSILIVCLSIPSILIVLPLYGLFIKFDLEGALPLMIVYACMRVPYSTTFLLNFFESISRTYEEAAAIDGCPSGKIFTKIMLPMVRPAIATISLFGFIGVLNEYMISLMLIPDGPAMSLGVGLTRVINALKFSGDTPAIFAAVLIAVAPSILLYAIFSKKIVFGGMGGGIKG